MSEYYDLFIPEVDNYGCVIMLDDEPVLFLLDDFNNMIDGIGIYNNLDENLNAEVFLMLDDDEMVIVSVTVTDEDSNIIDVNLITDENYTEYFYIILPLKMYTHKDKTTSIIQLYNEDSLEKLLVKEVEHYKKILKKSISNLLG